MLANKNGARTTADPIVAISMLIDRYRATLTLDPTPKVRLAESFVERDHRFQKRNKLGINRSISCPTPTE